MDIPKAEDLTSLASALAPGLIILGIRQRFVIENKLDLANSALRYAFISAIYYSFTQPLTGIWQSHFHPPEWYVAGVKYAVAPTALGVFAALEAHYQWTDKFWRRVGAGPIHPDPTAWDYTFLRRVKSNDFLIVTLTDGSTVHAQFNDLSFASSNDAERDLLLGEVWEVDDENNWSLPADPRSILLCGKDIRFVEILRRGNYE